MVLWSLQSKFFVTVSLDDRILDFIILEGVDFSSLNYNRNQMLVAEKEIYKYGM